jgi:hypothetical protein
MQSATGRFAQRWPTGALCIKSSSLFGSGTPALMMWLRLIIAMLVAPVVVIVIMCGQYFHLRGFRRSTPKLHTDMDMVRFKRLASIQMYVSLAGLIVMGIPLALWVIDLFWFGEMAWLDLLLFVLVPFAVECAVASVVVGTSRAVRSTPASDLSLASERDRVVDIWLHRALPSW